MYKPPIEIVMKEVFQKMNEDFENSVLKAVQKVDINVDKEELLKALIYDRGQYDKGYEDAMNEVKHPQPLKFEDLKEGMWIYDAPYEEIVRIKEIESNEWIFLECIKSKDLSNTFFQEGRFYPITIPNIGDKMGNQYRRMQTVKHALQYYITRPGASEKDLVREKNLLKRVEEDIEWYEERHHIKKKEERTND